MARGEARRMPRDDEREAIAQMSDDFEAWTGGLCDNCGNPSELAVELAMPRATTIWHQYCDACYRMMRWTVKRPDPIDIPLLGQYAQLATPDNDV